ncbi:MAG: aminoglycoside 3'-phosphotransferase, partial [Tissierellia bacterium]|nr:aminoglycoside 3'-phosphotransferase [Tissierellia bacterium]
MEYKEYPKGLRDILKGMNCEKDKIGKSSSKVLRYYDDKKSYYLKVESNYEIKREAEIMDWLKGRLPVPEKIYFESSGEYHYLLMTELKGLMLSSDYYLNRPEETVKLLAEGIRMLQSLPIDNCPFDARLEKKLKLAEDNIINGLVDTSTWEEDNNFSSPEELLEYLKNKKPKNTTLSFTHGDYTL